ncbi:epoxide hydrolase family protein [Rugosimonospora africana]|uniref:Multidrug MFS transporter n=1 Tax=Rugosimonospora africana TaxID=556532 RepID=A0A8J3VPU0_9ACTN|nr:epoxide hydrolase family protein [Rugosimonospora africana]GIH14454.1 multidrug MFS transporter [Rugosimonospora africana]
MSSATAVRPFRVEIPEADLADLRQRVAATRWPDAETVPDQSQGVQLSRIQDLARYWGTDYDWRKAEAKLNALPQFVTTIDGLDIHFIHVRSPHPNAMPMIITHGWPGSILEMLKVIGPLTDPPAHGGRAEDAFDLVIPSLPGYGFSGKPTSTGWNPDRIASAWAELMGRLGYERYVAQGGDWGALVTDAFGRQAPSGLLGIHVNMPATVPGDIMKAILAGDPAPAELSDDEKAAYDTLTVFFAKQAGYGIIMQTRPQTVGYGLTDSPVGLAAFLLDHGDGDGQPAETFERVIETGQSGDLTRDDLLDDITLYWVTNSAVSSAQLYWENVNWQPNNYFFNATAQKTADIPVPVGVTVFPSELYRAPRSWTEQAYRQLIYFNQVDKGGHFAAWEQPGLFSNELREAFRSLR